MRRGRRGSDLFGGGGGWRHRLLLFLFCRFLALALRYPCSRCASTTKNLVVCNFVNRWNNARCFSSRGSNDRLRRACRRGEISLGFSVMSVRRGQGGGRPSTRACAIEATTMPRASTTCLSGRAAPAVRPRYGAGLTPARAPSCARSTAALSPGRAEEERRGNERRRREAATNRPVSQQRQAEI